MEENFNMLTARILDMLIYSHCEDTFSTLEKISGNTLFVGSGGSRVVAEFAKMVLEEKNKVLGETCSPRDLLHRSLTNYQNILIASYSGKNWGVETVSSLPLQKYLLSTNEKAKGFDHILLYKSSLKPEKSFISLGATMMPITLLLFYYTSSKQLPQILLIPEEDYVIGENHCFEIYSGIDTKVAATYLESTIIEAGLGEAIIHDKYDFCHGRSTHAYTFSSTIIYLVNQYRKLDKELISLLRKNYEQIIVLESSSSDNIIGQYQLLWKSLYLTRQIAAFQHKDLSKVCYDKKIVPKIYAFQGEM